ncbi:MAG: hypothetical protein PHN59_02405 [Candidatus Omnitrophica bacterium]|nr:hypothetical protein [Candidatus Omnitrophota bacterium]
MKKKWQRPNLTVMVRKSLDSGGESVLGFCKMLPSFEFPGPYIQVFGCYNQVICEYKECHPGVQNYCGGGFCSDLSVS